MSECSGNSRGGDFSASIAPQGKIDYNFIAKCVKKLKGLEWAAEGPLRYLKGISGSKILASDILALTLHNGKGQ